MSDTARDLTADQDSLEDSELLEKLINVIRKDPRNPILDEIRSLVATPPPPSSGS